MMKRLLLSVLTLLPLLASAQELPYWNNLEVLDRNKTAPHVLRMDNDIRWRQNLDGMWDFFYVESPADAPDGVLLSTMGVPSNALPMKCKRGTIRVPGNMEFQGFGVPVYVNVANEFKSNPPYAPTEYNPVGAYVREFDIDSSWMGRRTFLKIGAVKSNCYLYVNGQEVGYSQDSKTPAEFEVSRYLKPGRNRVCVKVYRFCDGSYLECQDFWRVSGITRSVELYSLPKTFIKDFRVKALLDTVDYSEGLLDLTIDYSNEVKHAMKIEMELSDARGISVIRKVKSVERMDWYTFFIPKELPIGKVNPWTPEHPYLYTLTLRLRNSNDSLLHEISSKIGFRNVKIRNVEGVNLLCLNGKPVVVKGVNRHEHSGITGQYVSAQEMREDIRLMKEANINAVRTCHYPDDELWYDLCDSAGLLVWDEANVESHAQGYGSNSLAKKPEWEEAIIDRVNNMYQRDKNHPSVFVWSLGNECGNGVCFENAYRFLKGKDATRPVAYERTELDWNTDIVGIMYPSVDYLSSYARDKKNKRPYIMVEYAHAMGNSVGGLQDYWDTIDKYPILQGGFIWDWIDQSMVQYDEKGRQWMAVGGDLGSIPDCGDDDAFCANGLVNSDHTPHAHYYHVQQVYGGIRNHEFAAMKHQQEEPLPGKIAVSNKKGIVTLGNNSFNAVVNTWNGQVESYQLQGRDVIVTPIRPNFWRPPTLNDLADRNGARAWQGLDNMTYHQQNCKVKKTYRGVEVDMLFRLEAPEGQMMMMRQIIEALPSGQLNLSFRLEPQGSYKTLPKMGIQMGVDTAWTNIQWYGSGVESYPDRRSVWQTNVAAIDKMVGEMHVVPQESGNYEASCLTMGRMKEGLFTILPGEGQDMLNFSLRRYADSTLTRCRRINQLPDPLPYYVLSIDHLQAGIGGATCGPGVRTPYLINGDSVYIYSFCLYPRLGDSAYKEICVPASLPKHAELQKMLPRIKKDSPVSAVKSNVEPNERYGRNFPNMLFDTRNGVPGAYEEGWAGFYGQDSVVLEIILKKATPIEGITIGVCNAPHDWVVVPSKMEVSIDGGEWLPITYVAFAADKNATLSNPNASPDRSRLRYHLDHKQKKVSSIKIRILPQTLLPKGHAYEGEKAWLMIDEIEIQ